MSRFDTVAVVDWSAGRRAARAKKDAIWIGITRDGVDQEPLFCPGRHEAEDALVALIAAEQAAGRRLLIGFDFPFGYPQGFARQVTGQDDPFALWDWLEARIEDAPDGAEQPVRGGRDAQRALGRAGAVLGANRTPRAGPVCPG